MHLKQEHCYTKDIYYFFRKLYQAVFNLLLVGYGLLKASIKMRTLDAKLDALEEFCLLAKDLPLSSYILTLTIEK